MTSTAEGGGAPWRPRQRLVPDGFASVDLPSREILRQRSRTPADGCKSTFSEREYSLAADSASSPLTLVGWHYRAAVATSWPAPPPGRREKSGSALQVDVRPRVLVENTALACNRRSRRTDPSGETRTFVEHVDGTRFSSLNSTPSNSVGTPSRRQMLRRWRSPCARSARAVHGGLTIEQSAQ